MISIIIGIASGILTILAVGLFKQLDKKTIYGLILSGIGFLYVGYTWSDLKSVIITSVQAIIFLFIAYYGIKKSLYILAAGYFLHGIWDLAYDLFPDNHLIPPHYDLFCLSIDFFIGIYLVVIEFRNKEKDQRGQVQTAIS
jgi:vacuolar-type H+-ATPase subunit I/STV1